MEGPHIYVWEREHGTIPEGLELDHTCYNRLCCDIKHLRLVTRGENSSNRSGPQVNNSSGYRNVYHYQSKWMVQIRSDGKLHYFGLYETIEEAAEVAAQKREELFGEFAGRG